MAELVLPCRREADIFREHIPSLAGDGRSKPGKEEVADVCENTLGGR